MQTMRKRTAHDCCLKFWFDQPNPLSNLSFKDLSHMHISYFSADFVLKSDSNDPSTAPIHWSTFFSLPILFLPQPKFANQSFGYVQLSINHLPLLIQLNTTGENSSLFQIHTHTPRANPQSCWAVARSVLSPVLPTGPSPGSSSRQHLIVHSHCQFMNFALRFPEKIKAIRRKLYRLLFSDRLSPLPTSRPEVSSAILPVTTNEHSSSELSQTSTSSSRPHLLRARTPEICPSF